MNATLDAQRQRGFSLVELMVGIVIALMASLAIFQTYATSEERRRTTTSGGEGLQSALFALTALEHAITNAGFNLTVISDPGYTSPVRLIDMGTGQFMLSTTNPPRVEGHIGCTADIAGTPRRIAPLLAANGGAGLASDTLLILTGNSPAVPVPAPTETALVPAGTATLRLRSTHGFAVGDWVLVYEQSSAVNVGTARPANCTFARVIGLPNAPAISPADITLSSPTVATYTDTMVINLGQNPTLLQYLVDANRRLLVRDLIAGTPDRVIAENVVSMQVQLGVDVGNDDVVDAWIDPPATFDGATIPSAPMGANQTSTLPVAVAAPAINQIKALRVGLLVRSPRFERPDAKGDCTTTVATPPPVLGAVAGNAAVRLPAMPAAGNFTLAGDDRCYRYNTVTATVPMRNAILSEM